MAEEITTVAQRVRNLFAEQACLLPAEVTDESILNEDDLDLDSLDIVEMCMAIEDDFALGEVSDEEREKLSAQPVGGWIQFVEARLAAKQA